MKTSRYSTSRQKACQNCSTARAKCDLRPGRCSRCTQRDLQCTYPQKTSKNTPQIVRSTNDGGGLYNPASVPGPSLPGIGDDLSLNGSADYSNFPLADSTISGIQDQQTDLSSSLRTSTITAANGSPNSVKRTSDTQETLEFSGLDLICPINVDEITTRWMNPYIPDPGQKIKSYPTGIISFISRMLNSYAAAAIRGHRLLPFIHPAQIGQQPASSPLTTCLSLVRMCQNSLPSSEDTASLILQREMENVTALRETYDDMSLLAAFQAYLIYAMVLFFRLNQARNDNHLRQAMINLQELAHASSRLGLVCAADQHRARPRWEAWIVTEAKRRTLYVMYLFDSILSAHEGLPTFVGTELQGLPAPSPKSLWQAQARSDWDRAYNVHLAEWMEHGLSIDELWSIPTDLDDSGIARRRSRVDHWLEDIDEFGTMLYAVMSCTHGG